MSVVGVVCLYLSEVMAKCLRTALYQIGQALKKSKIPTWALQFQDKGNEDEEPLQEEKERDDEEEAKAAKEAELSDGEELEEVELEEEKLGQDEETEMTEDAE